MTDRPRDPAASIRQRLLAEEDEWKAEARRKIAEGMARARTGQSVDSDEAFERLARRIDAHQPSARGR